MGKSIQHLQIEQKRVYNIYRACPTPTLWIYENGSSVWCRWQQ